MADGRGWFPGQGGWQENEGPEDLAALRRTNRMIDAIAADLPVATSDSDEYAVAMMLAAWREDVGREPMPAKPTLGQARNALRDRGGRSRMLATTVGSAAAVTLLFGGFGAAVYQSHPGDALYGLRTSLFGAPPAVRTDPVVLSAQTELAQVEKLISQGDWEEAQQQLGVAAARVNEVGDAQQKAELASRVQQAEVRIDAKDPQATVPPEMVTETPRIMLSPPSIAPITSTTTTSTTSTTSASTTTSDSTSASTSTTETSGSASPSTSSSTSTSATASTSVTSVPTSTPTTVTITTTPPSSAATITSTPASATETTTAPSVSTAPTTSVPGVTASTTVPPTASIVTVPTTPEGVTIVTTRPGVVNTPVITAPTTIEAPVPITRTPDNPAPAYQAPVNSPGSGNLHGYPGSGGNAGSDGPSRHMPAMTSVPVAPANPGSGSANQGSGSGSHTDE
ncbi:anti-sigma-D factor RsdA [Mycobacteroides abscessus]|uniref:anti-sigma-D factor RsdA n=1 Tax=Mycobacteroides abscessus TaxID=36809 RepID=UPI000928D084|nr:anti-sigma-D factor RsdA [Mycobacteroides abscessus]MDM1887058.1 anti-sigma-D factor RsdA [Mycobacteroides abscessus]MDM1891331.1 anti-sigma-D factor RsdA [Mycobacteroides abscessus]MDM2424052.1 anti-sigma-D factor RsdA [Mycobacteroides abscessus]MDM2428742.1 anti-sigma-D factor RsdA [Mycobacteroides abscessus]MDM2433376.1 anti-sigma-D factor RsdA [Mycobacteroides abscessus]